MFTANLSLTATVATSDFVQLRAVVAGQTYYGANTPKTSASNLSVGATVSGIASVAPGDTLAVDFFNSSSSGNMVSIANRSELFITKIA